MSKRSIFEEAQTTKTMYDENDPIQLCYAMDILVLFSPMGVFPGSCKGFFMSQNNVKAITINSDLSENVQRIVAAHELGHAVLHDGLVGTNTFRDFSLLMDTTYRAEYEANVFAAELLLEDEEVLNILQDGTSIFDAAVDLRVPPELLDIKIRSMQSRGYSFASLPLMCRSDFLKSVNE